MAQTKKATKPAPDQARLEKLKLDVMAAVDKRYDLAQQLNDALYSYAELGFQEKLSSQLLAETLEKNGFKIERGVAGIPTAFSARWGSGKPVIAIGSDIDCLPETSQTPGVAYYKPQIPNGPGHGEGHNTGMALNVAAALAVKEVMEREKISGTLLLWPGIAEEIIAGKAFYTRDGLFKDADACLFTHVSTDFTTGWGDAGNNGLVSVKFTFEGASAHAAGSPWKGRDALDAVELMNMGWNARREHLELTQRSHRVIVEGGFQPNVTPSKASVWYYFRERTYPKIVSLFEIGKKMAEGAALMTDTKMSYQVLGAAWPGHFNKPIAEAAHENIKKVGMPQWSEDDQLLAKACQLEMKAPIIGLKNTVDTLSGPAKNSWGGGSDDIGDVSWALPTIVLRYPSNIPGMVFHHWSAGIAVATPIAHKGNIAGAKAIAMTTLDLLLKPELVKNAWDYYNNVQTKDQKYIPLLAPEDRPATFLNTKIMEEFRPQQERFYYDATKYKTYLEQLGVKYPTLRDDQIEALKKLNQQGGK
ncbi:MAG: amidohydrolase [Runella sp.]